MGYRFRREPNGVVVLNSYSVFSTPFSTVIREFAQILQNTGRVSFTGGLVRNASRLWSDDAS